MRHSLLVGIPKESAFFVEKISLHKYWQYDYNRCKENEIS